MYGCDHTTVGCLTVSASRIGSGIDVDVSRIGIDIVASASRIGSGIDVTCGLVCKPNDAKRILEIQPEVIFLTPENGWSSDVMIISNVEWTIE